MDDFVMTDGGEVMVTAVELGHMLDLTPRRVAMLASDGVIPKARTGVYPRNECIRAYVRFLRERADAGGGSTEYSRARAKLTSSRAAIAEMERSRLSGELAPVNEYRAAWTAITAGLRARLLAIPSKCAPRLIGKKHAADAKAIVENEIHEALEDLAAAEIRTTAPPDVRFDLPASRRNGRKSSTDDPGTAAEPDG